MCVAHLQRTTDADVDQDIALAKALSAHSPSVQDVSDTALKHGVDLILGGHDHLYFVTKGVSSWKGYDVSEEVLGAEDDKGDVLIIKSGTDFRDLSEFTLELEDTSEGSVRRKLVKAISGTSLKHIAPTIIPTHSLLIRCSP